MDDAKRILVFSDAGGTGRSYHAELSAKTGGCGSTTCWKPDGRRTPPFRAGRTNRTNQAQPPLFRPIATNVKPRSAFSAPSPAVSIRWAPSQKGQRQTGGRACSGQKQFWKVPNARDALRQLYLLLVAGKVEFCTLQVSRMRQA